MGEHIKEYERYLIESWLKDGMKVKDIAERLGKHYNTIYYEIKKGRKCSIASTFCNQLSSAIIVSHYTQSKKFSA